MSIDSIGFIILTALILICFNIDFTKKYRGGLFFVANLFFLSSQFDKWHRSLPVVIFLISGFGLIKICGRVKKKHVTTASVIIILSIFAFFKNYFSFLPAISKTYVLTGMSYMLFRIIHLVIDMSSRALEENITIKNYLNYVCFFPSLVTGPIQRYQDYVVQERNMMFFEYDQRNALYAISRIINGFLKVKFLSAVLSDILNNFKVEHYSWMNDSGYPAFVIFGFGVVTYILFLYFNFSGSIDIVNGVATLLGFKLPENFDRPFSSNSFLEFWSRWHISLSEWFKIYMFNPLVKWMMSKKSSKKFIPVIGVIAYFITFLIIGIWHGSLTLGVFLAMGVSVNKIAQIIFANKLDKNTYKKMRSNVVYQYFCRGLVFGYFALSGAWLWITPEYFFSKMSIIDTVVMTMMISVVSAVVLYICSFFVQIYHKIVRGMTDFLMSITIQNLWVCAKVFILMYVIFARTNPAPEFIYKAF